MAAALGAIVQAGFLGLQWRETREQACLTTKPRVDFGIEDDSDEPMVGMAIKNAGPGPPAIKAITFYVDRKPVADADEMGRTYAKLPAAELDYQIMEPGDTRAVGETIIGPFPSKRSFVVSPSRVGRIFFMIAACRTTSDPARCKTATARSDSP
jgi:hypothetical protein